LEIGKSLSHRERAAEGRVRDLQDLTIPHPSLRDTLSRWERGSFSDDTTNWEFVKPLLEDRLTICAIDDEARDIAAVIATYREPVRVPPTCMSPMLSRLACPTCGLKRSPDRHTKE